MNVFEEQRLYHTSQERENYESMATLFSLISCLDYLERAYVRGAVQEEAYTPACTRLLAQYKTVIKLITDADKPAPFRFADVGAFMRYYDMDYPAAAHRLALGVPATVEHASGDAPSATQAQLVAETTQYFITLMDALKLKMRAKDQLHPLLSDLLTAYTKAGADTSETRAKLVHWLITLNQLSASEEMSETDAREMLFDIEHAYSTWFQSLQGT
ncbi:Vacuolar protein-sorting-associated protein 28 [Malassezia brasiliensis]|uniref:Vacuolar protein sorting-associated protein 28 n=1 Tax=Malassezia brasiliensis TaxID=1821822 RepID=A0AAF0DPK7_9BASI|nr:Vacuolar protein-sorting-associated protein 28 [Malassezia brasiliensis]